MCYNSTDRSLRPYRFQLNSPRSRLQILKAHAVSRTSPRTRLADPALQTPPCRPRLADPAMQTRTPALSPHSISLHAAPCPLSENYRYCILPPRTTLLAAGTGDRGAEPRMSSNVQATARPGPNGRRRINLFRSLLSYFFQDRPIHNISCRQPIATRQSSRSTNTA